MFPKQNAYENEVYSFSNKENGASTLSLWNIIYLLRMET